MPKARLIQLVPAIVRYVRRPLLSSFGVFIHSYFLVPKGLQREGMMSLNADQRYRRGCTEFQETKLSPQSIEIAPNPPVLNLPHEVF